MTITFKSEGDDPPYWLHTLTGITLNGESIISVHYAKVKGGWEGTIETKHKTPILKEKS